MRTNYVLIKLCPPCYKICGIKDYEIFCPLMTPRQKLPFTLSLQPHHTIQLGQASSLLWVIITLTATPQKQLEGRSFSPPIWSTSPGCHVEREFANPPWERHPHFFVVHRTSKFVLKIKSFKMILEVCRWLVGCFSAVKSFVKALCVPQSLRYFWKCFSQCEKSFFLLLTRIDAFLHKSIYPAQKLEK